MATLTGQSIASSYEQLLSLPDGGGATTTLKAVTDGDAGTTFAMQLSTTTVCIDNPTADSSTQGGILRLQSDDGALMQSGSRLGVIEFGGAEDSSSTITVGGRIESVTDADWSATENGADMVFYTTDGDASQSEVMRLTADNHVGIGTVIPGSTLPLNFGTGTVLEIRSSTTANSAGLVLARSDGVSGGHIWHNGATFDLHIDNKWTNNDADIIFRTHTYGTPVVQMTMKGSGGIGIGTGSPANPLAVNRSGDGVIVDFESADAVEGTVSISGTTTSYNAFVGSHYTQLKDGQNDLPVGAVVSSTGEIITCNLVTEAIAAIEAVEAKDAVLDDDGNITEEAVEAVEAVEAIPVTTTNAPNKEYFTYINTTTTESDPTVYGTWMGKMSDDAKGHSFGDDEKPIYLVAQVGLFKIRVTDTNGDIAKGDYLESSTRAMEGQKQTSNARVNSTIGKAMIDVDWSSIDTDSDLSYKWKLIPCIF